MELHTFEDWIIERAYRSVPGVADDSGLRRHRPCSITCCSIPRELYNFHLPVVQVVNALHGEQRQHRRRLLHAGRPVLLRARPRPAETTDDIGEVVVGSSNGVPVRVKDIGQVVIGHAPRLGIFGFQTKQE